jgi:hypothetical protein
MRCPLCHEILDLRGIINQAVECLSEVLEIECTNVQTIVRKTHVAHHCRHFWMVRYRQDRYVQEVSKHNAMEPARHDILHQGHVGQQGINSVYARARDPGQGGDWGFVNYRRVQIGDCLGVIPDIRTKKLQAV